MTTSGYPTVRLDDQLARRLFGAISEFLMELQRPANIDQITSRIEQNIDDARQYAATHNDRAAESALRAALSGQQRIGNEILVELFNLKMKFTLQRDKDILQTQHHPLDLMHALVAHVGSLLREIGWYNDPQLYNDGTFRLDADWGDPHIEKALYPLRARLRDILSLLPHSG